MGWGGDIGKPTIGIKSLETLEIRRGIVGNPLVALGTLESLGALGQNG